MAHLIGAESVSLAFPTKDVLTSVTLGLHEGDRVGIVGRNGDGKTSLLRVLAGQLSPDAGRVTRRGGVEVGLLDQRDEPAALTVRQAVVGAGPEHEWATDPKIRDVIGGLLPGIDFRTQLAELSGGQRRRVALAALLARDDDVLLLDEPTNHLDLDGITWLARHLRSRWPKGSGALAVVTHDRWFLDEVCGETWEVHDGLVEPFEGGYAAYILQRVERDRLAAQAEAKRQNILRKELAWLRRGAPARTSKPQFRIEAANRLIADEPPPRDQVALAKLATARLGKDVIELVGAAKSYGDKEVLRATDWMVGPGDRIGILGANGAGKSTLLALATKHLEPTVGRVKLGKTVRVAVLTQSLAELDEISGERLSDVIARYRTTYSAGGKDMSPAQLLERLGFASAQLASRVGELSGGQRRRLQFLLLLLDEPNVLVLDEPTNDLDTDMLAAMEDLLDSWPGTLLVVSHDRYLLERVCDSLWAVIAGELRHLPGGVDEYLALSASDAAARPTGASPLAPRPGGPGSPEPATRDLSGAERRALEKEIAAVDRRIAKTQKSIDGVHAEMADFDQSDYVGLGELTGRLRELESELAAAEERWLEVSERL